MKKADVLFLAGLGALGIFIWWRDLRWLESAGDTLPILSALPLFVWFGGPWERRQQEGCTLSPALATLAAILFPLGVLIDSGLVLAASWAALLGSWISANVVARPDASLPKLLVLPLLSFPWLITDFERLAWWFRLSGAAATEAVLSFLRVPVLREGTYLWANGLALSVEPACSGVNGLQSMLVAGAALAYLKLRGSTLFWWNLPLLAGAAWLAHVLRIVAAALCGVVLSPAMAARSVGPIHTLAGWLGLVVVFWLCYEWFSWQEFWFARRKTPDAETPPRFSWAALLLLAYTAFCSRGLIDSWLWAPYDRLAWLAFAIWLLPLLRSRAKPAAAPSARSGWLIAAGGFSLIGAAADINALHHCALACALAGFQRTRSFAWTLGAFAWMPVAGWFGSRLGLDPMTFSVCRVIVALAATIAAIGAGRGRSPAAASAATLLAKGVRHAP